MRLHALVAALSVGVLGALAAPARAESGRLADFSWRYTTKAAGVPTGVGVHIFLRAAHDPEAKPSPLRSAVIHGPAGLRFDTGAVSQCMASDEELKARGSDACPPNTELTVGAFTAIGGFGPPADPFMGDDHVFDGPGQIIEVITVKGGSASPGFDRLTIDGSTLTAHPPMAPGGPPDGESSVRSIDFQIPVRSAAGRSLITTPPSCPAGAEWKTTATFGFADGSSDRVASASPCTRPRPRLRLAVHPGRVVAGQRTRFTFRAGSPSASCVSGVAIRFAGRRVRTGRHGRAELTATLRRTGAWHARATKPGCREADALVRVAR
jgi:hypothetical protein